MELLKFFEAERLAFPEPHKLKGWKAGLPRASCQREVTR